MKKFIPPPVVVAILTMFGFSSANTVYSVAYSDTGAEILYACRQALRSTKGEKLTTKEDGYGMYCLGYLAGISDHIRAANSLKPKSERQCMYTNENGWGFLGEIVKRLEEHPEDLNKEGGSHVIYVLSRAIKCR